MLYAAGYADIPQLFKTKPDNGNRGGERVKVAAGRALVASCPRLPCSTARALDVPLSGMREPRLKQQQQLFLRVVSQFNAPHVCRERDSFYCIF